MLEEIISNFKNLLNFSWDISSSLYLTAQKLYIFAQENKYTIKNTYEESFIEATNQKLSLNSKVYQSILDTAFTEGIILNYVLKTEIKEILDKGNKKLFKDFLMRNSIFNEHLFRAFKPIDKKQTLDFLHHALMSDEKHVEIVNAIFSRYYFNLFEKKCTFHYFSGSKDEFNNFFDFISHKYPDICNRDSALTFIDISESLFKKNGYEIGCNIVLNSIKETFTQLNNHCELVIYIPQIIINKKNIQWNLYSDIILYAEKHVKEKIDRNYFCWKKIAEKTCKYIQEIEPYNAQFEWAFQGFSFKDCFVIENKNSDYSLLLVFEKNIRDERLLNCPACYSNNVQGNSYPILNVRSWECNNELCPDRSKYNRGKRYSFISLFRQSQLLNTNDIIPKSFIDKWHLDCLCGVSKNDIFEMAIRYYSCTNDRIIVYTENKFDFLFAEALNRELSFKNFIVPEKNILQKFKKSTFFYRYIQEKETTYRSIIKKETKDGATIFLGDSYYILKTIQDNSIDGAVTSPPYYNAKSYSQWPNIYCYLFDMYNILKEMFRVLKPGSIFLYNIFDYFDNENIVALSAMGNKRMILGAYMIDIFNRIGFNTLGNIIWHKGEIQGNRRFNQGNLTPYYQSPLNCWEHIFILSKGQPNCNYTEINSKIAYIKPVIKMVRGKNIVGHEAPFPQEIPNILIKHMKKGDCVLDPFLGSGTTGIVAQKFGINFVGIEKNEDYFNLAKNNIFCPKYIQKSLFDSI